MISAGALQPLPSMVIHTTVLAEQHMLLLIQSHFIAASLCPAPHTPLTTWTCCTHRYSNRKLTQELETAQSTARSVAERNRTALQRLQEGLAGVEAAVEERSQAGYQQVQATFAWVQKLHKLLLPSTPVQHSPSRGPPVPREAGHIISEVFRSLSALGTLLTSAVGARPMGMPGSPAAAAAAAAVPEAEVEQLCNKVAQLSERLQDATSDKLALQSHIAGGFVSGVEVGVREAQLHSSFQQATCTHGMLPTPCSCMPFVMRQIPPAVAARLSYVLPAHLLPSLPPRLQTWSSSCRASPAALRPRSAWQRWQS
jgi:hypothetical protein